MRCARVAVASVLASFLALTVSTRARADQPPPPPPPPPPQDSLPFPALPQWSEPVYHAGHWESEEARPFISLRADVGYLYLKPRFSFGYGKPFVVWGGLDILPFALPDEVGGYSGLRVQLDWFELRAGARVVHALTRQYLTPKDSYNLLDLSQDNKRAADYLGLEAEASAAIPVGPGNILALFTASSIQFVPAGSYVYDETLRVVISPPPVYRGRLGYSLTFGHEHTARLGLLGEVVEIPDRNAQVVRVGLIGSFDIDDHLQLVATVMVPVYSPDSLGLLGADYTELGVRWRWATGHTHAVPHERNPNGGP